MKTSMNIEYLTPLCEEARKHCDKYESCGECPRYIQLACDKLIEARDDTYNGLMFFNSNLENKDFQSILHSVYTLEEQCRCTGECEKCVNKIKCQNIDEWTAEAHEKLIDLLNEFLLEENP